MIPAAGPSLQIRWIGTTRVLTPVALFLSALVVPGTERLWLWLGLHTVANLAYLGLHWRSHPSQAKPSAWLDWYLGGLFCFDVWLETLVVASDGGMQSDFILLFVLTATLAGFLMRYQGALLVAIAGLVLFGSLAMGHLGTGWSEASLATISRPTVVFRTIIIVGLGTLVGFLTAYLSDTLQRQRALSEDQARDLMLARLDLDGVLNRLSYGVLVMEPQGKLLYFNQSACSILRHPLHPGARLQQVLASETWGAELVDAVREVTEGSGPKVDREVRISPSGWIQVQIAGQWMDGQLRNVVVALQDISAIRKMEEEVRSGERMATMGHMAARIAHEIRNPMASITGSAQLLTDSMASSEDDRQLLGLIRRESERLDRILSEFLDYSRPRTPSPRPTVLTELLSEIREMVLARLARDGREGVTIKTKCQGVGEVMIDRDMVLQILFNFAINGLQAIPESIPGMILLDASADAEQIRFRVRDNGVGMSPEVLRKVGEAFYTTRQGGVGLGVAISRHLTALLGGTFRVQSLEGRGTVVEVAFPQEQKPTGTEHGDLNQTNRH
ncbi:MAG TPA: ATP-binding protein [Fibrobacteria bacterium]|nr:ATP-binding protein [Fibrobacteria bacterium]